jgi:hypothetical protein
VTKIKQSEQQPDQLVPDPQVWRELGISSMSGWRWDREAEDPNSELAKLGWPLPISIRKRNFRSRRALEQFKANAQRQAIQNRARRHAPHKRRKVAAA